MRYINTRRKSADTVLIFNTEEGGDLTCLLDIDKAEFEKIIKRGYFEYQTGYLSPKKIYPVYMMLASFEDGYDFRLEKINTQNGYKKSYSRSKLSDYLKAHR